MTQPLFEFRVEGWRELSLAIADLPPKTKRVIRRRMRRPAQRFVDQVKSNITAQGLVKTGNLVRRTRVSLTRTGVAVVNTAEYGRVHEFGLRHPVFADGDDRREWAWYGEPAREFFYPASDQLATDVANELVDVVTDVADGLGLDLTAGRFKAPTL